MTSTFPSKRTRTKRPKDITELTRLYEEGDTICINRRKWIIIRSDSVLYAPYIKSYIKLI